MNSMQAMIDGMNAQSQRERAESQMTLGELIERLEQMPKDTEIQGLAGLNSYRGYYSDLAFDPTDNYEQAGSLLERCKDAMGKVFTGYKGGDYVMGALTPLWVADYGRCGQKLIAINDDGSIKTGEEDL